MKKTLIFSLLAIFALLSVVSALPCNLDATLVNQDPYPAVPGEYVKVVFQLSGIDNPECGNTVFSVHEEFPFSLKPGTSSDQTVQGGVYARKYESFAILPFELIVDNNALDGANPIEVSYGSSTAATKLKEFSIEIEDVRTDFEVAISDYVQAENRLTFSILNTGDGDAEAVVIEIPRQDNIQVKGASKNIVGSLDSKDDTTFSFEAVPSDGEININILYSDETGVRRTVERTVLYDSSYFTGRVRDVKTTPTYMYWIVGIIVLIIIWRVWKGIAKRRKEKAERHHKK